MLLRVLCYWKGNGAALQAVCHTWADAREQREGETEVMRVRESQWLCILIDSIQPQETVSSPRENC